MREILEREKTIVRPTGKWPDIVFPARPQRVMVLRKEAVLCDEPGCRMHFRFVGWVHDGDENGPIVDTIAFMQPEDYDDFIKRFTIRPIFRF